MATYTITLNANIQQQGAHGLYGGIGSAHFQGHTKD